MPSHKMTEINFEDAFYTITTLKTVVMNGDSVMMILVHLLI
ncbi:phage protein F-like protein [Leptotrichia wadei]|uniref:Phage protein F-like protein n=1 Tax=Leptotrichia wadei TaxID=157687 RepID=A0A510KAZ4_9FUSO|nr:phage protein F-like protein [Leptotrichia wadei]